MDINELLKGKECSCGKFHKCDIKHVFIEDGASDRLDFLCKDFNNILVVADGNTYGAYGDEVADKIKNKNVKTLVFDGNVILVPNEDAIKKVEENLDEKTDVIIGIGSGVIQDLCKYVSFFHKLPYIVAATAPSMDGYASDGAAMILNGMKETVMTHVPFALIADPAVLMKAPKELIKAGYGDIIGKFSALNDWKLAKIVNDEYYCDYVCNLTDDMVQKVLSLADGIKNGDKEAIGALMEALIVVGIAMSFATSSRPASGSEHHLSHFFEIVGIVKNEPYLSHGLDVAYSTVVTAKLREELCNCPLPETQFKIDEKEYKEILNDIYGPVGEKCYELQVKSKTLDQDRLSLYKKNEKEIKELFKTMPTAKEIENMLGLVDIDMKDFYKIYSEEKLKKAIYFAKDLKNRYSVLWMYFDIFGKNYIK